MDIRAQVAKAERFRALHRGSQILVLPNVWDVAGARLVEQTGLPAVATSSAGIAFSLGYPDGQRIPCPEMVEALRRIARAVDVPVTADFESGYGETPAAVSENVRSVLEAGAVGINFEDSGDHTATDLCAVDLQVEKIKALREMAATVGIPLVINARTDVYLLGIGDPASRFDHAVRRANAYRKAGADCLFVPGVMDAETIGRLTKAIDGPVNILAGPGCPSVPELKRLGVARVSVGSRPMCAAMGLMRRIMEELRDSGTYDSLKEPVVNYAFLNKLVG